MNDINAPSVREGMGGAHEMRAGEIHRLGLAGMGRNVGFGVNKVFVGPILQALNLSQPMIGLVLGLEGLFGLILNPLTGWLSDRTVRPGFRRKIYVLTALPGAAILWLIFEHVKNDTLAALIICLFYVLQQLSIAPYQAWMPELVPQKSWGVASGYLNLWWELGNLTSFLVIPLVYTKVSHVGAFVLAAVLMAGGGLVTGLTVREPAVPTRGTLGQSGGHATWSEYKALLNRNLILYFCTQAFAWIAFESIASFFTLYVVHAAHGKVLDSALAMSLFTITGVVAALSTGFLYRRFSPKSILAWSMLLFGLLALFGLRIHTMGPVFAVVGIEGFFWGAILTVAYAFATDLLRQAVKSDEEHERILGGMYGINNVTQSVGLLVAAPTAGLVIRLSGGNYGGMFLVSAAASFLGFLLVLLIQTRPE